ncbi:MAG: PBP1A family penicillin-binding protein [Desulfotomaculaceae bacterium]
MTHSSKNNNGTHKRRKKRLKPLRLLIFIAFLALLTTAGAAMGLVAVSVKDLPPLDDAKLIPATATQIYDHDEKLVTQIGLENRVEVSVSSLPEHVKEAFLAAEDHFFYEHHGIRIKAIFRAAFSDVLHLMGMERSFQGGSTITQQLVKMSFLTPEKSLKRKIQEALLSFQLERRYSKDEILGMYLNRLYLGEGASGGQAAYGVQAAAQVYFNKDAKELTINESAVLAGITNSPSNYSPYVNMEAALTRRNQVLQDMLTYGFIDEQTYQQVKTEEIPLIQVETSLSKYPYPYFVDYITDRLLASFGEDAVFKGGLKVYTTMDPKIQGYVEAALAKPDNFPASNKNEAGLLQPQGSMVVLDPGDGSIRALVGGREHTQMRALNRATMSPRQPGSSIKPILAYAPAIEFAGMGPASIIDDAPIHYSAYGNYAPKNSSGGFRGLITMRAALTSSVNIAAVKLLMEHVTMPEAIKFASRMDLNFQALGPSMALGSQEVTPLQLAAAYAAFPNQGIFNTPHAIIRVEDREGNIIYEADSSPRRAMKETTAYLTTSMLQSVVQSGTGTNARLADRPAAGKTGTTDEGKDIWFAGYTPNLVGVVWIGYDQPTRMSSSYGGTFPAKIWREVMTAAHKDQPVQKFVRPAGIVSATVDSKSGLLPGPNTPPEHLVTDLFAAGTVPTKTDNVHVLAEVCATTGLLPNEFCPDRITQVMLKIPYSVSESVADFDQRLPTEICEVHSADSGFFQVPGIDGFPWTDPNHTPDDDPDNNIIDPNRNDKPDDRNRR